MAPRRQRFRGRWTIHLVLSALGTHLLACSETPYGIERSAILKSMPNVECIRDTLRTVPGLTRIEEWNLNEPNRYSARYEGGDFVVYLVIVEDASHTLRFSQTRLRVNRVVPHEQLVAVRGIMQLVERRLESDCRIAGLQSAIAESCPNTDCEWS